MEKAVDDDKKRQEVLTREIEERKRGIESRRKMREETKGQLADAKQKRDKLHQERQYVRVSVALQTVQRRPALTCPYVQGRASARRGGRPVLSDLQRQERELNTKMVAAKDELHRAENALGATIAKVGTVADAHGQEPWRARVTRRSAADRLRTWRERLVMPPPPPRTCSGCSASDGLGAPNCAALWHPRRPRSFVRAV